MVPEARDPGNSQLRCRDPLALSDLGETFYNLEVVLETLQRVRSVGCGKSGCGSPTSSEKRSSWRRISPSGISSLDLICPVKKPCPRGEYPTTAIPSSFAVATTTSGYSQHCTKHDCPVTDVPFFASSSYAQGLSSISTAAIG